MSGLILDLRLRCNYTYVQINDKNKYENEGLLSLLCRLNDIQMHRLFRMQSIKRKNDTDLRTTIVCAFSGGVQFVERHRSGHCIMPFLFTF